MVNQDYDRKTYRTHNIYCYKLTDHRLKLGIKKI